MRRFARGINAASARQRIRDRIAEIDARAAGRALPLRDGGSLTSGHATAQLARLTDTAAVSELEERADGRRCFILQHADEADARLAEIWLMPAYAGAGGRFDCGLAGAAGVGPTLLGAQTHAALPLAAAAPLVAHVIGELRGGPEPVEAAAALPGLCAWITEALADGGGSTAWQHSVAATEAAMQMALDGNSIIEYPRGLRRRTEARPVWEALAARYAQSAAAEEAALYRACGAADVGIAYVADIAPEALSQSGGAMSMLAWPEEITEETGP